MVTHQLQVERRTAKSHRPKTDALPLDYATNRTFRNCLRAVIINAVELQALAKKHHRLLIGLQLNANLKAILRHAVPSLARVAGCIYKPYTRLQRDNVGYVRVSTVCQNSCALQSSCCVAQRMTVSVCRRHSNSSVTSANTAASSKRRKRSDVTGL